MSLMRWEKPIPCKGCGQPKAVFVAASGLCQQCTNAKEKAGTAAEKEIAVYRALMADPQHIGGPVE